MIHCLRPKAQSLARDPSPVAPSEAKPNPKMCAFFAKKKILLFSQDPLSIGPPLQVSDRLGPPGPQGGQAPVLSMRPCLGDRLDRLLIIKKEDPVVFSFLICRRSRRSPCAAPMYQRLATQQPATRRPTTRRPAQCEDLRPEGGRESTEAGGQEVGVQEAGSGEARIREEVSARWKPRYKGRLPAGRQPGRQDSRRWTSRSNEHVGRTHELEAFSYSG